MPQDSAVQLIAMIVLIAAAAWLVAVGLFMAMKPRAALGFLRLTASSQRVNLTEQGLRMLAGVAMIARSPQASLSILFEVGGWFILLSSVLLIVMPLPWHAAYAIWWADRLPHWVVRLIGPLSILFGAALIYSAV